MSLYREVLGRGAPFLAAGGIHLDHRYLRPWLDPLADAMRLVYFDHRGTGRSPRPASPEELGHGVWAEDIDRLRAGLDDADEIVLFGHSYGGYLALEYALRHPGTLRGLVLCSTAPAFDYPATALDNARRRGTPEQLRALERALGADVADDDALCRIWLELLPLYFHERNPGEVSEWEDCSRYAAGAFNHAFGRCLPGYDVTDRLGEIRVPTLVLVGRHDWITPPAEGAGRLLEGIPDARGVVFEESGHFPFMEEPERFLTTVRAWLEDSGIA
ncbi:MAG: alpha/beta fold hydrolase [Gemmatimonadetes bacterium]|nr:alpha/beta fold hydrolase [Gemmatimonadota bacterium]NIR81490.1 alpha/beta fold hydrolase [Gemmatimonadota bacterium]NIT90337.1 alpha/beta fold hydrolase [Gemmatimonadota bacterium]NIU34162.1 alpha/beta fold hydrolase [Gemmatimonadota bacterium]NIU38313.1 alpha/beta fold hydrolase [Gemmatimonadota bacterium]